MKDKQFKKEKLKGYDLTRKQVKILKKRMKNGTMGLESYGDYFYNVIGDDVYRYKKT